MRVAQLLINRGFLSVDQILSVPGAENMEDGQLGSALVEAGLVTTDQLALILSDVFGVPPALETDFLRSDPGLRKRLRAHQATSLKSIPLYATQNRRIAVAMVDPSHPKLLDELGFALCGSIEPMVTSEHALARQLELLYGMPRRRTTGFHPVASVGMADAGMMPRASSPTGESRRLQLVPPAAATDSAIVPGAAGVRVATPAARARSTKLTQPYLAAVEDLPLFVPADAGAPTRPVAEPLTPVPPMVAVTGSDRAVEQILSSPDRQAAADNLFAFMRSCFGAGAMFVINGVFANGRFGYNEGTECPAVESLVFSLSLPSAFRSAHTRGAVFHGAPSPDGESIHGPLWVALRCPPPRELLVAPVVAGGQVSLLLYAHGRKNGRIEKFAVARMEHVCAALANTLVRLAG
jgi:hypothetical protein